MTQFTLEQAVDLLPQVQQITAEAVQNAERLVADVAQLPESDPKRRAVGEALQQLVSRWVDAVTDIGAEAKGLWLVDFDSGDGYWCWKHPEPNLEFWHSYEGGFAGRRPITPLVFH